MEKDLRLVMSSRISLLFALSVVLQAGVPAVPVAPRAISFS